MKRFLLITGNLCHSSLYKSYYKLNSNLHIFEWWKLHNFSLDKVFNIVNKYDVIITHSAGCSLLAFILSFYKLNKPIIVFSFDGHGLINKGGFLSKCYNNFFLYNRDVKCIDTVIQTYTNINPAKLKNITIFSKKYILDLLHSYKSQLDISYFIFLISIVKFFKTKKPKTNPNLVTWIQIQSTKNDYSPFISNHYGNNHFINQLISLFNIQIHIDSDPHSKFPQHFNIIRHHKKYIHFIQSVLSSSLE